jgi:hypothetical protein
MSGCLYKWYVWTSSTDSSYISKEKEKEDPDIPEANLDPVMFDPENLVC